MIISNIELISKAIKNIDDAITDYTQDDLDMMKKNVTHYIYLLEGINNTEYQLKINDKIEVILIKIDKYRFGHNDMLIYCHGKSKLALADIFYNWYTRIVDDVKRPMIPSINSNGFGTAFRLNYDSFKPYYTENKYYKPSF